MESTSTSASGRSQKQLTNMTDLCLYLSYFFQSSAPVGDRSTGSGNNSSLSSYPGDTGSIIDYRGSIVDHRSSGSIVDVDHRSLIRPTWDQWSITWDLSLIKRNWSSIVDHTGSIIDPLLESIKYILAGVVNPTLCVFGLVGNIFNVVVLSRSRMQAAMSSTTMERSAYIGLIALAVSDALYCVSALLGAVQSRQQTAFRHDELLRMYVQLYGPYLQNTFMHTGCWLTVLMATGRYAAICRPLQASSSSSLYYHHLTLSSFWTRKRVPKRYEHCCLINQSINHSVFQRGLN